MYPIRFLVPVLGALFGLVATVAAEPGGFERFELSVPHPVRKAVFAVKTPGGGGRSLVVAGVGADKSASFSVFPVGEDGRLSAKPARTVQLAGDVLALDGDEEALYALTPSGVQRWNPADDSFSSVAEATSIFQLRPLAQLIPISFLDDADGDGRSDIVLPDFNGYRVFFQEDTGGFRSGPVLQVPAISHHQEYNRRITYRPVRLYFLDGDGDGTRDAVAVRGGSMIFFAGEGPGRFAAGRVVPLGLGITERFLGDDVGGVDVDHTDQTWKRVVRVGDFDGNGKADLFTHTVESEGLFDKTHVLQLHSAKKGVGFDYESSEDGRIDTNVVIDTPSFADVNGDGRTDFGTWSVDFGIGTIFGWLVSGTVDLEVSYYALGENGRYPSEPDRREEVEVAFDLASGKPTVPPWFLSDINGDSRLDLILGEGDDKIRVFLGDGSEALFAADPVVTEVRLPGNGRDLVSPADVNGDGKADIVLRYGRVDGDGLDRTLQVLIAQ
ncbi:MAG: VCBS repeat-containing protein [Candidatus Binatia bacterium]|nr:VCBS repeat-containing protein [Candidatus Binatia bacterium]